MSEKKKLTQQELAAIKSRQEWGYFGVPVESYRSIDAAQDVADLLDHIDVVEADNAWVQELINRLDMKMKVVKMEAALKFYADEKNYPLPLDGAWESAVDKDRGQRAREALKANGPG